MTLPVGYRVFSVESDSILVAVTDFSLMGGDAPTSIEYDGKVYYRGMIESIPKACSSNMCSLRRYDLTQQV